MTSCSGRWGGGVGSSSYVLSAEKYRDGIQPFLGDKDDLFLRLLVRTLFYFDEVVVELGRGFTAGKVRPRRALFPS